LGVKGLTGRYQHLPLKLHFKIFLLPHLGVHGIAQRIVVPKKDFLKISGLAKL